MLEIKLLKYVNFNEKYDLSLREQKLGAEPVNKFAGIDFFLHTALSTGERLNRRIDTR